MNKRLEKKPLFYAVSGVKNSGKTTLITKLLPILTGRGLKVATIKHDGHDFQTDVPERIPLPIFRREPTVPWFFRTTNIWS